MAAKPFTSMSFGDSVYTTAAIVRFAVQDPKGGFGQMTVYLLPGETKSVKVGGKTIKVCRPLLEPEVGSHGC